MYSKDPPGQFLSSIYAQGNSPLLTLTTPIAVPDTGSDTYINIAENTATIPISITGIEGSSYVVTCNNCTLTEELEGILESDALELHLSAAASGTVTFSIYLTDASGYQTETETYTYTADLTTPTLTDSAPTSGSAIQTDETLVFTFSETMLTSTFTLEDSGSGTLIEDSDGGVWSSSTDTPPVADSILTLSPSDTWQKGVFTFTMDGTDLAGNPLETQTLTYSLLGNVDALASTYAGSSGSEWVSVDVDSSGNAFAVGYIKGSATYAFDSTQSITITGTSITNGSLVKYQSNLQATAAVTLQSGAAQNSTYYDIAVASDGTVYAVGFISGTSNFDFGDGVTQSGDFSGTNAILACYDNSLTASWVTSPVSAPNNSVFRGVTVASDGSIYVVGVLEQNLEYDFGNSVLITPAYAGSNLVIVKYDNTGTAQWVNSTIAAADDSLFNRVDISNAGTLYAVGSMTGTGSVNLGNSQTFPGTNNGTTGLIVAYDPATGDPTWCTGITSGSDASEFLDVSVDGDTAVVASGYVTGDDAFELGSGNTYTGPTTEENACLVKLDTSGNTTWITGPTSAGSFTKYNGVSVLSDSNMVVVGVANEDKTVGLSSTVIMPLPYDGSNTVIAKYNSSGNVVWGKSMYEAQSNAAFNGIACSTDDATYFAAGVIYGTNDFWGDESQTVVGTSSSKNVALIAYTD